MGAEADCIFCKIIAGDLPGEIVDSDLRTVAFMDINPATPGHALVVPRAHSADLIEIADDDLAAMYLTEKKHDLYRGEDDHTEVEMLLESYHKICDETAQEAQNLVSGIRNTEEM